MNILKQSGASIKIIHEINSEKLYLGLSFFFDDSFYTFKPKKFSHVKIWCAVIGKDYGHKITREFLTPIVCRNSYKNYFFLRYKLESNRFYQMKNFLKNNTNKELEYDSVYFGYCEKLGIRFYENEEINFVLGAKIKLK